MAGLEGSREGCGLGLSSSRNHVIVIGELKKAFGTGGGSESIVCVFKQEGEGWETLRK